MMEEYENLHLVELHNIELIFPLNDCNLCSRSLCNQTYIIDGNTKNNSGWAYIYTSCFDAYGTGIGWGTGQLYKNVNLKKWLLVAGFPPLE